MTDILYFMTAQAYEQWYRQDVSPNLNEETKEKILKKISDLSLERPLHLAGVKIPLSDFPELAKFAHTEDFSGIELCVVMTEIARERGMNIPPFSQVALKG